MLYASMLFGSNGGDDFFGIDEWDVHSRSSIRAPFMPGNGKTCVSFSSSDEDTIQ